MKLSVCSIPQTSRKFQQYMFRIPECC